MLRVHLLPLSRHNHSNLNPGTFVFTAAAALYAKENVFQARTAKVGLTAGEAIDDPTDQTTAQEDSAEGHHCFPGYTEEEFQSTAT